jgi:hypothetical protein
LPARLPCAYFDHAIASAAGCCWNLPDRIHVAINAIFFSRFKTVPAGPIVQWLLLTGPRIGIIL